MSVASAYLERIVKGDADKPWDVAAWIENRVEIAGELLALREQIARVQAEAARRRTRKGDGREAGAAARLQAGKAGPAHRAIMAWMVERGAPASARQAEAALPTYGFSTARKRFGELVACGWLEDAGTTETDSGQSPARQYRLPNRSIAWPS